MIFDVPCSVLSGTSLSLLQRVKASDSAAWKRLVSLYSPMVYLWARKANLQAHDAEDVVQNVFLTVYSEISRFRRSQTGDSFRGWLWTICNRKVIDHFRAHRQVGEATGGSSAQLLLTQIAIPKFDADEATVERRRLYQRALAPLHEQFDKNVWQAFIRVAVHGDRAADVAKDLGISIATVYRAKSRVLTQLRTDLDGL